MGAVVIAQQHSALFQIQGGVALHEQAGGAVTAGGHIHLSLIHISKEYNLDNVNQGKNLFILYDIYGDEKYRKAIDTIDVYKRQPGRIRPYDPDGVLPRVQVRQGLG